MIKLQATTKEIEIKGFNSICYLELGKNFTHAKEKHDFWEMVYVDSGKVTAITDGNRRTLKQGEIIFHEPNEVHTYIQDMQIPSDMIVVSFTCNSKSMEHFRKKIFIADKTIRTLLSLFVEECKDALGEIPGKYNNETELDFSKADFGAAELMECYFTEMLIAIIRTNTKPRNKISWNSEAKAPTQSSLCGYVSEYMKENLYSKITLSDICSQFMVGKSQLSHIFKNYSGKSIMEYYNDLRIKEAKKLLRYDEYSVSEISDMLGYSCIHSFSRAFKNSVGFSPTAYKNKII